MNRKRHRFSSPEIELKHSFQAFKKHFITFYNDVYGGSVEEYVEELPDGKRRAICNEMTGLLKNVKRLDKVIMKMKETNMKLSRLSDRQLRRLVRNAEVRFGNETVGQVFEEMAKAAFAMQKKLFEAQDVGEKVFRIAHKLPPKYEKELKGFNEMWNKFFYYALANIGYRAGDFKDAARKYKDTPIK